MVHLLSVRSSSGHGLDIVADRLLILTMVQMFEIWTNEDASEFAAKLSGNRKFIIKTNLETTYSRLMYAAPFVENNVSGLAHIIDAMLSEMDKPYSESSRLKN